jgi:hypothetical protein
MHSISARAIGAAAQATVVAIPTRGSRHFGKKRVPPAPTHPRGRHFELIRGIVSNIKAAGLSADRWNFRRVIPGALAHTCALPLLCGLASCTGSPATLALQPAFDVMTPAGIVSVSIRESPAGMTDAEFTRLVMTGMQRAAPASVIAGRVAPPFPPQRIVWHVNLSAQRGISRLVVNVFDGANAYAYEQDTVTNGAPTAVVTSAV